MEINSNDIREFFSQFLNSRDKDSLITMRIIMNEFKKTFHLEEVGKALKNQIKNIVEEVLQGEGKQEVDSKNECFQNGKKTKQKKRSISESDDSTKEDSDREKHYKKQKMMNSNHHKDDERDDEWKKMSGNLSESDEMNSNDENEEYEIDEKLNNSNSDDGIFDKENILQHSSNHFAKKSKSKKSHSSGEEEKFIIENDIIDNKLDEVVKHHKSSRKQKTKNNKKEDDSAKLRNFKRYIRQCGMHLNYLKFFADCCSMKGKEKKLENYIREITGIEGRITLEKCKRYKLKKEEADELAELDIGKIIGESVKGRRVTRQSISNQSSHMSSFTPVADKIVFKNLRDLVDSDDSDSEIRSPNDNITDSDDADNRNHSKCQL